MKKYPVKKLFGPTIYGEGGMSGTLTHFLILCSFNVGGNLNASEIVKELKKLPKCEWVVIKDGADHAARVDQNLVDLVKDSGFRVAVETDGEHDIKIKNIDKIIFSPKVQNGSIKLRFCHTLKLQYPHPVATPEMFENFTALNFYLQPIEDENYHHNLIETIRFICKAKGKWKLSLPTQNMIGANNICSRL